MTRVSSTVTGGLSVVSEEGGLTVLALQSSEGLEGEGQDSRGLGEGLGDDAVGVAGLREEVLHYGAHLEPQGSGGCSEGRWSPPSSPRPGSSTSPTSRQS